MRVNRGVVEPSTPMSSRGGTTGSSGAVRLRRVPDGVSEVAVSIDANVTGPPSMEQAASGSSYPDMARLHARPTVDPCHQRLPCLPARQRRPLWQSLLWTALTVVVAIALVLAADLFINRPGRAAYPVDLDSAQRSLLRSHRYYIALNLFNSEVVLQRLVPQLLRLVHALGPSRCYVGIYENGSTDRTQYLLSVLRRHLDQIGARHSIVTDSQKGWRYLCRETESECYRDEVCQELCDQNLGRPENPPDDWCGELRYCDQPIRIPIMAALRNRALANLGWWVSQDPETPTQLVFLNDIRATAEQIVELILTKDMQYDMACGLDFVRFKFYDTWVTRDIMGHSFSPWYPFVRHPASQEALRQGKPFRVYSCWNGAAVMSGNVLDERSIKFRAHHEFEPVSPLYEMGTRGVRTFGPNCPASECQLLPKDLWASGFTRIYLNPNVHLVYDSTAFYVQRWLMSWINPLVMSWAHVLPMPEPPAATPEGQAVGAGRTAGVPGDVDVLTDALLQPPEYIACGAEL